jgi:hypothetical protein
VLSVHVHTLQDGRKIRCQFAGGYFCFFHR